MRKRFGKKILMSSLALLFAVALVACDKNKGPREVTYRYENLAAEASVPTNPEWVSYVEASYEEKTKILGLLEKYAVDNFLTGLTLFDNGGEVLYHPDVVKGSDTFIPGYGFGILAEGNVKADLASESKAEWKRYYHTHEADDPSTINYMNDKGSVVGTLQPYISASYWDTAMNEAKNGYNWIPDSAKEKPVALNDEKGNGLATKYRWEVKVGDELKYATLSTVEKLKAYNGRTVALEDYLTPFKTLHTKKNGMARGAEGLSGSGSIKGMQEYYNSSDSGFNATAWEKVGLKAYEENGKSYVEVEFNNLTNRFYAMYYMSSSLYAPIPQAFIDEIGGIANYGNFVEDPKYTPVDTTLSTGAFVLERWDNNQQIVFKRNVVKLGETSDRYKMAGIHIRILSGQNTDPETVYKEFIAGKLHFTAIPSTKLSEHGSDPRKSTTVGNSTSKLNLNTTTPERWEELFGENGTVAQTTVKKEYWKVKPIMSNPDFIKGLNYALNRKELAAQQGRNATADYFASAYLSNPEEGISYNDTPEHAAAVKGLREGTEIGYSLELAKIFFKRAADQLVKDGVYKTGATVEIEIAYQAAADITRFAAVAKYFEDAFNTSGAPLTLKVKPMAVAVWTDIYYKKMMVGQFDIAMGGINGNTLNPLNFMEVLKSDNSSGFTLNWGVDTSKPSSSLQYDGRTWSYDALFTAAEEGCFVENGRKVDLYAVEMRKSIRNAAGEREFEFSIKTVNKDKLSAEYLGAEIVYYDQDDNPIVREIDAKIVDGILTFKLSAEDELLFKGAISIDFKFKTTRDDVVVEKAFTLNTYTVIRK